jgi:hypothetical protein
LVPSSNILFSAIVGFTAMVNPLANYYTKFYFGAIATLWATTFSFAVLFTPIVFLFYKQWKKRSTKQQLMISNQQEQQQERNNNTTTSSSSTEQATTILNNNDDSIRLSFLKSNNNNQNAKAAGAESIILYEHTGDNTIITNSNGSELVKSASLSNYRYDDNTNVYVEVQEGYLPTRKAFRYFPFLSQWKMRRLMVFPRLGYISYYSVRYKIIISYVMNKVVLMHLHRKLRKSLKKEQ